MTTPEEQLRRYATDVVGPPRGPVPEVPRSPQRPRVALVAAVVAFVVLIGGGALVAVSGRDQSTQGSAATQFVLPPSDATIGFVSANPIGGVGISGMIGYVDATGAAWYLHVHDGEGLGVSARQFDLATVGTMFGNRSGGVTTTIPPVGDVVVGCTEALWVLGGELIFSLSPSPDPGNITGQACERMQAALGQQISELRLVDAQEWNAFVDEYGVDATPGSTPQEGATPPSSTTTTTRDPQTQTWCTAIEAFRSSGTIRSDGTLDPDARPYLQTILDASPPDLRGPTETMLAWIDAGSPTPMPADVSAAEGQATTDWVGRCQ